MPLRAGLEVILSLDDDPVSLARVSLITTVLGGCGVEFEKKGMLENCNWLDVMPFREITEPDDLSKTDNPVEVVDIE